MFKSNTIILTVIMMIFTFNIITAESNNSSFNYGIFLGYGYFDYNEINYKFDKFYHINAITTFPFIGFEFGYEHSYFILTNQLSFSFPVKKESSKRIGNYHTFREVQNQMRVGYSIVNYKNVRLFPFSGLIMQYLLIDTDVPAGIKTPDCFFRGENKYGNFSMGILYGISLETGLFLRNPVLDHFRIGIDVGGSIPVIKRMWWINGEKIHNTDFAPDGNFRYFGNIKLVFQF